MQNGNDINHLEKNPLLLDTFNQYRNDLTSIRDMRDQKLRAEREKRKHSVVTVDGEDSIPLNAYNHLINDDIKTLKIANCGELTRYFQYLLDKIGLSSVIMAANIKDSSKNRVCSDHVFLVAGLPPNANLKDPSSFPKALALDSWWETDQEKGLFLPVQEYMEKLKQAFQLDEKADEYLHVEPNDNYCHSGNSFTFPTFATVDQLLPKFKSP